MPIMLEHHPKRGTRMDLVINNSSMFLKMPAQIDSLGRLFLPTHYSEKNLLPNTNIFMRIRYKLLKIFCTKIIKKAPLEGKMVE